MKKKGIAILIVLILISIYFIFIHKGSQVDGFAFKLEDTSSISHIVISKGTTEIHISKQNGQWMVNRTFNANPTMVKQVLRLFMNLEISYLVPKEQQESKKGLLKKEGVKIQFYADVDVLKEFWIGNYIEAENATLLMNEDESEAYVTAPGLSKDIRQFVEPNEIFWRNKQIFNHRIDAISEIKLHDFKFEDSSFTIAKKGNKYILLNANNETIDVNEEKLVRYLSYYGSIRFESLADNLTSQQQDSVLKQNPIYSIELKTVSGQNIQLKLFTRKSEKPGEEIDLNFAYGNLNNERLVILIGYFQVDPIIKGVGYFME